MVPGAMVHFYVNLKLEGVANFMLIYKISDKALYMKPADVVVSVYQGGE